jgi:hypothetical protein
MLRGAMNTSVATLAALAVLAAVLVAVAHLSS